MYNLKKSLVFAILFILFISISSKVFASEINMNLSREANVITGSTSTSNVSSPTSAVVSTVDTVQNTNSSFGINTILDILLIAIGFVIILLAIAILIRLKH